MSLQLRNTNYDNLKEISSISVNNNVINAVNEPYRASNIFKTFFIEIAGGIQHMITLEMKMSNIIATL